MSSAQAPNKQSLLGGKYLTFFLGEEEYGASILAVQEIIGLLAITTVPSTPKWVRGVINLRGKIIPVVDLRAKFGMTPIQPGDRSCIVVVQAHGSEIGIIVDRVSEVVDLPPSAVESAPALGAHIRTDYLLGIGKLNSRVRLLLDIERSLSPSDVARSRAASSQSQDGDETHSAATRPS